MVETKGNSLLVAVYWPPQGYTSQHITSALARREPLDQLHSTTHWATSSHAIK